MSNLQLKKLKNKKIVKNYIDAADKHMEAMGYTEHGRRHAELTSKHAEKILTGFGYENPIPQMGSFAGYLHDIGNMFGRIAHEQAGAVVAMDILEQERVPYKYIAAIGGAIGSHEEDSGEPVNEISAALIIADKADVHRSRVKKPDMIAFDIHDRVNYAATKSDLLIDPEKRTITLKLEIDTKISKVVEYFEIFLSRMVASRKAADFLDTKFELIINNNKLL